MEIMNPSLSSSAHRAGSAKGGTPFAQAIVQLTKQEYVQLKWDSRYWQRQHKRAIKNPVVLADKRGEVKAMVVPLGPIYPCLKKCMFCRLMSKSAPTAMQPLNCFRGRKTPRSSKST